MIVDCISDLHGEYPILHGGDLLIVAGDLTASDKIEQHEDFREWLQEQKYTQKIFIGGNHDNYLTKTIPYPPGVFFPDGTYLCDSGTTFRYYPSLRNTSPEEIIETKDFKIWGSPWSAGFAGMNPHCMAFTMSYGCDTEEHLEDKWAMIPEDTDILITHSPPYNILDWNRKGVPCGSKSLLKKARKLPNLKLWVFGHIHESYGMIDFAISQNEHKFPTLTPPASYPIVVNASIMDENYDAVNKPIRIIL